VASDCVCFSICWSVGFGSLRCGSGMGIGYDLVFQCCLVGSPLGLRSGFWFAVFVGPLLSYTVTSCCFRFLSLGIRKLRFWFVCCHYTSSGLLWLASDCSRWLLGWTALISDSSRFVEICSFLVVGVASLSSYLHDPVTTVFRHVCRGLGLFD
jgi:hypothetical protein